MNIVTQEKIKEYNQRYYAKNREKIRRQQKESYDLNREELLEKQKVRSKRYYENNRDKILERVRARYANNVNGAYDRKSFLFRESWKKNRQELFDILGGAACDRCGFDDVRALEVDHVNGGGNKHRKTLTSHRQYADYIKYHLDEFQILCCNCHAIKTYENREVRQRNAVTS